MISLFVLFQFPSHAEEEASQELRVKDLPFSERFSLGTQLYHSGEIESALQIFVELANEPSIPLSLKQEARVYIAELHYVKGNKSRAQAFFEQIVMADPEYQIDRFKHPPDVCGLFDFVKTYQQPNIPDRQPALNTPQPFPLSGYGPFGIYQLRHQPLPKGVVLSGLQIASVATSVTTYIQLNNDHSYVRGDTIKKDSLEQKLNIQRASTVAFYALWAASIFDAQRHWNLNMSMNPSEEGIQPTIGVEQRF